MDINGSISRTLYENGASIVGFADLGRLGTLPAAGLRYAVSIAVALDAEIISDISGGPTTAYFGEYEKINDKLSGLGQKTVEILTERGASAVPLSVTGAGIDRSGLSAGFPHKTAATLSGIGWIGKSALLVTRRYGCAVRLTTVLTDMAFDCGKPVGRSLCGSCRECVDNCPGKAIKGANWRAGMDRDGIYDAFACRRAALEQAQGIGINNTICGICIAVCPWTKAYINKKARGKISG
jgi:epoxyqueuosine reductase QueG